MLPASYIPFSIYIIVLQPDYIVYMHEYLSLFIHTYQVASDDPGFARPDIRRFISIVQVLDERIHVARNLEFLSTFQNSYPSCTFFILVSIVFLIPVYQTKLLFHFLFHVLSCVDIYMRYCNDHDLLQFRFIPYFGLLKAQRIYVGYFLVYMCRQLASLLRSNIFWEAGRDIVRLRIWIVVNLAKTAFICSGNI